MKTFSRTTFSLVIVIYLTSFCSYCQTIGPQNDLSVNVSNHTEFLETEKSTKFEELSEILSKYALPTMFVCCFGNNVFIIATTSRESKWTGATVYLIVVALFDTLFSFLLLLSFG